MADVIDTIDDSETGTEYTYFDDGSVYATDADGNVSEITPPNAAGASTTTNPADTSIFTGGTPTTTPNPLPDQIIIPVSAGDSPAVIAARIAAATSSNPSAKIVLPTGITDAAVNSILATLATTAGRYAAQVIGGSTILTRQGGGIGTLNIQSLLVPGAIIAGIVLLSGKG